MAKSPTEIFRDHVTQGIPSSGDWTPRKADIREYLVWLETQIGGGGGGGTDYSDEIAQLDTAITNLTTTVGTKAAQSSLDSLSATVAAKANQSALNTETAARIAGDAALSARTGVLEQSQFSALDRVGEAPEYFTATLPGAGRGLPVISTGTVVVNDSGTAYRVSHVGTPIIVAARRDMPVEGGVTYAVRFALRRASNTTDPYGDGIDFGIAWLKNDKTLLSSQRLDLRTLSVTEGRITFQRTISMDQDADIVPPSGARYMRPYLILYGNGGSTDIEAIARWETKGLPGPTGDPGDRGWAVEPETVQDGPDRVVLRVADFIGGQGDKPEGTGKYIGIGGLVNTAAEAINVKGNEGAQGPRGAIWRGYWDPGVEYISGDIVIDDDANEDPATWIALTTNTNSKPHENASDWAFFPASTPAVTDYGLISDPATSTYDYGTMA